MASDQPRPGGTVRVCVASPRYFPDFFGPVVRFVRYTGGLSARNISLHFLTCATDGGQDQASGGQGARDPEIHRLALQHRKRGPAFWREFGKSLHRHCIEYPRGVQVIQLLDIDRHMNASLRSIRRAGTPIVYTHTMMRNPRGPAPLVAFKDALWRRAFRHIDCVVVSSGVMRKEAVRRGVPTRVEVIPNGVDLKRFRPATSSEERESLRLELGMDLHAPYLLFVGHLSTRKGADLAASCWSRVAARRQDVRFLVIVPTAEPVDPQAAAAVQSELAANAHADRVTIVGPVDNVEEYLRAADVLVFSSRREGMPNVIPEAYASGVACVLAPFLGLPEEFGRAGQEYLLAPHDADALSTAVLTLIGDEVRRRQVAEGALLWAARRLSLEVSLDQYASLYTELATQRVLPSRQRM